MKTLFEIIETAKDGGMPTHEECYWAMLALDALSTLDRMVFNREMLKEPATRIEFRRLHAENSHKSWHTALNKAPKDWLGPEHDPSNAENQRVRKIHKRIYDKFVGTKGPEPGREGGE